MILIRWWDCLTERERGFIDGVLVVVCALAAAYVEGTSVLV